MNGRLNRRTVPGSARAEPLTRGAAAPRVRSTRTRSVPPQVKGGSRGPLRLFARPSAWLLFFGLAVASGCGDPKYKNEAALRRERMKAFWSEFVSQEKARPDNVKRVVEWDRKLSGTHARQLRDMQKEIDRRLERDVQKWNDQAPARNRQIQKALGGNPQRISETWPKLVY